MEPIQTKYKGYRFRSRLEARWAVFFDALDLEWIYEPEGFKLEDGTYYLPDFKVLTPYQFSHWYEIKPRGVTEDDKFDQFKDDLRGTVSGPPQRRFPHLLSGDPRAIIFDGSWGVCPRCGGVVDHVEGIPPGEVYCMPCDHTTPCGRNGEWQEGVLTRCRPYKGHLLLQRYDGPDYTDKYKRLLKNATRKARSARFEHGQKGA
jgi:hypothetical protein